MRNVAVTAESQLEMGWRKISLHTRTFPEYLALELTGFYTAFISCSPLTVYHCGPQFCIKSCFLAFPIAQHQLPKLPRPRSWMLQCTIQRQLRRDFAEAPSPTARTPNLSRVTLSLGNAVFIRLWEYSP